MPYKFETDKLIIPKEYNKTIKLTDEEKRLIKRNYGKISQRKLAKIFNVSRRLIVFIGCPEKYKRNLQARKERGTNYYDREKHKQYMKNHRDNKKKLYNKDLLEENKHDNKIR